MFWLTIVDRHDRGRLVKAVNWSWDQLAAFFQCPIATSKDEIPLVVGCQFKELDGEWRRNKLSCVGRNVVPLDFDHGWTFDGLKSALGERQLTSFIHTTASHTEDKPRLRAYVQASELVTPEQWDRRIKPWMKTWAEQDGNALDITRVTYAPVKAEGYRFARIDC